MFQTFYKSTLLSSESSSSIAWIGSLRAFLLLGSPVFYGPLYDLGYPRLLVAYGAILIVFGSMMTSLSSELWHFILAQGLVVGLGSGALFLTAVATISTWFTTKKSLAIGLAASGSSIGGVIYPIVFRELRPVVGFAWSVRTIGFITLGTNILACVLVRKWRVPEQRRSLFDPGMFKDVKFDAWCMAWFFANISLYIPYFFIQEYATRVVGVSSDTAFYTLTTINAASVFGRIIPGLIADAIKDAILTIAVCTTATTILAFCWVAVTSSVAGLFVFCGLYGLFSGAFVSLSTPATVQLAPSMKGIGTRLGLFNGIGSLGLLVGNPAAGAIMTRSWVGMQLFAGFGATVSLLLLVSIMLYNKNVGRRQRR